MDETMKPIVAPADPKEQCLFYLEDAIEVLGGPGKRIIDLGACVGDFLIPALEAGFEKGIAVECVEKNYWELDQRLRAKGLYDKVLLFHQMIGVTRDGSYFTDIDEVFSYAPDMVDLLKIDIEGSEYDAIMRAPSCHWMQRTRVMHLEKHNNPPEDAKLLAFLAHAGWVQAGKGIGVWRNTRFASN